MMDWLDAEYRSRRLPAGGSITKCRPRRRHVIGMVISCLSALVAIGIAILAVWGII